MFTKLLETDEWADRRSIDRTITNPDHYMIVAGSWEHSQDVQKG